MRQLINVSYVAQVENLDSKAGVFERWEQELYTPPRGEVRRGGRSHVTQTLDDLMRPGGLG